MLEWTAVFYQAIRAAEFFDIWAEGERDVFFLPDELRIDRQTRFELEA